MDSILKSNSFDELCTLVQKEKVIQDIKNILDLINLSNIKVKEFLALWILFKYPKETMGQNVNNDLLEVCHKIFTIDIKQYIHQGISKFRNLES